MINIRLEWHEFDVDLKSLHEQMQADYASYIGASASGSLVLHFEADSLTMNEQQDIKLWWKQELDEAEEAAKRALPSRNASIAASLIEAEKEAILQITDFSTLTELQKKIWMGLELSDDELDSLAQ